MASSPNSPENIPKKPTISESVDGLIQKKKSESSAEGFREVQQSAEGVQSEVADVMGGVDKPSERVSERAGESGEKGDIKGGGQTSGDDGQPADFTFDPRDAQLPNEEVMIRKVRTAINSQIAEEWKKAQKLTGQLATGGAQEYNSIIARIRHLKETLASLFTSTFGAIKDMYLKYFTHDGKRRKIDDIQA